MNTTNGTLCRFQELHMAIPVLLALLSVGGLVLNTVSLWIFLVIIKRRNASILLQINLAVVDTVILPVTLLMVANLSLAVHWPWFICKLLVFMLNTHLYGSIYSLMLISLHRYQVIVHYSRSCWMQKPFWKKLFTAFWVVLFLQGLPVFFFPTTSGGSGACLSIHHSELSPPYVNYGLVLLAFGFILPFVVSVVAHLMLGAYLSKISNTNIRKKLTKTKSVQIITVALVIFVVCFLPFHVCQTVGILVKRDRLSCEQLNRLEMAYFVSLVFSVTNCCLDPFIYSFANDTFHRSVNSLLRR